MRTLRKTLLILLVANIIRIIPGCCTCDESTMPFSFNKIDITNIDNSGDWPMYTDRDTMMAGAVAFDVAIFDSLGYYFGQAPAINMAGFGEAKAMKCDCGFQFNAQQYLTKINITTLYPLTPEIDAGNDVSDLFVAWSTSNSSSGSSLYSSLENTCNQTNGKTYYDSGVESFGLYLKTGVANTVARFVIKLTFSDNLVLSDTTNLIHIRNQ